MANFETTNYQELIDALSEFAPDWVDARFEITFDDANTIRIDADYVELMLTDLDGKFHWRETEGAWTGWLDEDFIDPIDVAKNFWEQVDVYAQEIINQFKGENA